GSQITPMEQPAMRDQPNVHSGLLGCTNQQLEVRMHRRFSTSGKNQSLYPSYGHLADVIGRPIRWNLLAIPSNGEQNLIRGVWEPTTDTQWTSVGAHIAQINLHRDGDHTRNAVASARRIKRPKIRYV